MRDRFDASPPGRGQRRDRVIINLPVEVVARNGKQNLGAAIGVDCTIDDVFTAQMHVRHETDDVRVLLEFVNRFELIVRRARRNYKLDIERSLCRDDFAYRLLREDQPNHRAILTFFAARCVVHLKD